jgi:hypothetical protein
VPAARADEAKTTKNAGPALVVRLRSLDSLIADFSYVAAQAGKEEEAKQAVAMLKEQIGEQGFNGIDVKKPIGGYVFAGPNGTDSYGAFMVPVKDEKIILDILGNFGLKPEKNKDGLYTIKDERIKVPVFFRFANGYAYIAPLSEAGLAKSKLLPPAEVLPESETALASISLRVDRIPDTIKEIVLAQLGLRMADIREQHAEQGTPAQRDLIDKSAKEINGQVQALVNDGRELAIRVDVDRQKNDLAIAISFDGKPGTKLAASIANLGKSQSLFAGLIGKDSAASFLLSYSLPERIQKALGPVVDEGVKAAVAKAKDNGQRELAEKLLRVLAPSFKAGEIDAAVDLRGPSANKHFTLVAGIKLKNGDEIEKTLKELIPNLPQEVRDRVKIDVDKAGNVNIHSVDIDRAAGGAMAREIFGNEPLHFAVRPNAMLLAVGEGGLPALKRALIAKPGQADLIHLGLAGAQLAPLMAKQQPAVPKAAEDAFGKNPGQDKVRFSVTGGNALKAEVHLKTAVLKFLVELGEARLNSEQ